MLQRVSAEDITGDKDDVKRVCKQIMNRAAAKRLISKQEACVLLGDLDLTHYTETVESVSISSYKLFFLPYKAKDTNLDREI